MRGMGRKRDLRKRGRERTAASLLYGECRETERGKGREREKKQREAKHAEEMRSDRAGERVIGAGREGGRECVRVREGRGASKHALHVIQSVHMALYYAVINT